MSNESIRKGPRGNMRKRRCESLIPACVLRLGGSGKQSDHVESLR